jgi:UDP-2,3-diacylglucosamine pyrophosphatase LpxH
MIPEEPTPHHVHPPAIVVSDLHLGSSHCRCRDFIDFLRRRVKQAVLVLNGDTIDCPGQDLPPEAEAVLEELARRPPSRVAVVRGNHDENDELLPGEGLESHGSVPLNGVGMLACHGDQFHISRPHHRMFVKAFLAVHRLRVRLGAPPVHVAEYAKRWDVFYRILRSSVRDNAVEYARQNGYRSAACGHVHYPEDTVVNGVRYFNTGCWTESPAAFLDIGEDGASLEYWP